MATRGALRTLATLALGGAMLLAFLMLLALAGATSGVPAVTLALLLAIVPVPFLLRLVLWLDRFEPEPVRSLLFAFAWGATFACFVALVVNSVGEAIVSEQLGDDAGTLYGGSISAPLVEEASKGAALVLIARRRLIDGVLDGIVYATLVGLGFAFTENVFYYADGAAQHGVVGAVGTFVVRGLLSPLAHPLFTAALGVGLGIAAVTRSASLRVVAPPAGLLVAMGLHSTWNTAAVGGEFVGVYLGLMAPLLVAFVAIGLAGRRRESRTIRRQLTPYVENETIAASDLEVLAGARERREALRRAPDRRRRAALAAYAEAATALAFLRDKRERGRLAGPDAARAEQAAVERMLEARSAALE